MGNILNRLNNLETMAGNRQVLNIEFKDMDGNQQKMDILDFTMECMHDINFIPYKELPRIIRQLSVVNENDELAQLLDIRGALEDRYKTGK